MRVDQVGLEDGLELGELDLADMVGIHLLQDLLPQLLNLYLARGH